jgi:hypothetical protein
MSRNGVTFTHGFHKSTPVWFVSQVLPVSHISGQRSYTRSKGLPGDFVGVGVGQEIPQVISIDCGPRPWISVRRCSRLALNGLLRLRCYATQVAEDHVQELEKKGILPKEK